MSQRISQWIGLIGIAATIPLVQTIATAKSSVEVAETARTITVLITSSDGQGSGVIIKREGDIYTVLTATHVVNKKVNYQITTPDDKQYEVMSNSIISAPGDIDLAVIKFKSTARYPLAKLGNCNMLTRGMELYVAGFPVRDRAITSPILVVREGKISANSNKTFDKGYSLIYSNDTLNGMSGGAVLNSNGELVAIHGRGDKDEDGRKNGFNLGIPIERFGTVASRMGVELNGQVAAIATNTAPKADDYFASGVQKYEQRDYPGALADYNRAIALAPNNAAFYIVRGKAQLNGGDRQAAMNDFNQAIAIDPKKAEAYFARGSAYTRQIDRPFNKEAAIKEYSIAIALDPKHGEAYFYRGEAYFNMGKYKAATNDFSKAISLYPNWAIAFEQRGNARSGLGDTRGKLADFQQAAALWKQRGNKFQYELISKTIRNLQQCGRDFCQK